MHWPAASPHIGVSFIHFAADSTDGHTASEHFLAQDDGGEQSLAHTCNIASWRQYRVCGSLTALGKAASDGTERFAEMPSCIAAALVMDNHH